MKIDKNARDLEKTLHSRLEGCSDAVFKVFYTGVFFRRRCVLIYIDGLCDKKLLNDFILMPLVGARGRGAEPVGALTSAGIPISEIRTESGAAKAMESIMQGNCVMLVCGRGSFYCIGARSGPRRAINEPKNKATIRGPRDGFNETLRDNTALLRSKIKSGSLKIESFVLGSDTNTPCALCYMADCANAEMVRRVRRDIVNADLKSVLGSGFVQKRVESKRPTFFPQMEATERPDEAARALLSGRVVVVFDNTPFVLIVPGLFKSMLASNEDFYDSASRQKIFLSLRIFAMVLTVMLPSVYIAVVEYSPEFVSEKLISFIIRSRKDIPFPAFFEILLVEFIFEIIIEAGIRLPAQLSFTVGIVGAIVLGQAMVDANLVNLTVVIFVALTAILVFVIPNYSMALSVRFLKFIFMAAAWLGGFFGIAIASLCTLTELCDMSFYGMEFMYPYVDSDLGLKDVERKTHTFGRYNI